MEVCAAIRRHDRRTANGQEVAVALDHVADDRIAIDAGNARAGQNDIGRKLACRNIQRAGRDRRRALPGSGEGAQTFESCEHFAIDLEIRVVGGVNRDLAEIALAVMERT